MPKEKEIEMKDLTSLKNALEFANGKCLDCLPRFPGTVEEYPHWTRGDIWFLEDALILDPISMTMKHGVEHLRRMMREDVSPLLMELFENNHLGMMKHKEIYLNSSALGYGFAPLPRQMAGIITAIEELGLSVEEVDSFMKKKGAVEGGKGTKLAEGKIGGCINPKDFLKHIENLLLQK